MKRTQSIAALILALLLLQLLPLFVGSPLIPEAEAADSISWFSTQKPMAIDYAYVDVNLTNFPVFVHLDGSIVDWTNVQDDLDDIRFVGDDNMTFLDYEIEDYVVNSEAWFWVLIPEVDSAWYSPFWLYYGNTTISSGENAAAVWDTSEYFAVYHMADNSTTTILDSTANNNDGTKKAAGEPTEAAGVVGRSQFFDGSDDYIDCGLAFYNYTEMSGVVILNAPAYDQERYAIYQDFEGAGGGDYGGWGVLIDYSANPAIHDSANPQLMGDSGDQEEEFIPRTVDEWSFIGWSWDGATVTYYGEDGLEVGNPDSLSQFVDPQEELWIGGTYEGSGGNYTGYLDLVIISNTTHSDAWFKAMAANVLETGASSFVHFNYLDVSLVYPANGATVYQDSLTVEFAYTPTLYGTGYFYASSLHVDDDWSVMHLNQTAITNATVNTISYALPDYGTYIWNVDVYNSTWLVSEMASSNYTFTLALSTSPPAFPPIIEGVYINDVWFFRSDTHTVHDILAYRMSIVQSNTAIEDSMSIGTSQTVSYGVRIWVLDGDGTEFELTGGSPEAIVTRAVDGDGEQSTTWTCDGYYYVIDAVKIQVYQRFGAGYWNVRRIFMSKDELLVRFPAATWTFTYYTNRTTSSTSSYFKFGDYYHLSNVDLWYEGVSPWEKMMYWVFKGDLLAFFVVPWTHTIGEMFYGLIVLFMAVTTYNRYQSIRSVMVIAWLFGGVGSFLPAMLPVAGLGLANLVLALAVAITLYKLFR